MVSTRTMIALAAGLVLMSAGLSWAEYRPAITQETGPVRGTVAETDDAQGLTVRADPSPTGRVVAFIAKGAEINTNAVFRNGWAQMVSPVAGAWVPIASVAPTRGTGTVASVDQPEMCLRVRSGPGTEHPVVGCLSAGERLGITGIWSDNNWGEIDSPVRGWVKGDQVSVTFLALGQPETPVVVRTVTRTRNYVYSEPVTYGDTSYAPVYVGSSSVYPGYRYGGYRPYRYVHSPYRHGFYPYRYGYRPGVGVRVGPYGGVGVRAGGVGVVVGPRGGVGVRVGGIGVGVGPRGGVRVRF